MLKINKMFILFTLTLGLILAQTCSAAKSSKGAKPSSDPKPSPNPKVETQTDDEDDIIPWDDDDTDEFFYPKEKKPSMSCLLLGASACSEECRLKSQLYNIKASGTCDQKYTCDCQFKNLSFDKEWEKKFDSDYVHRAILDNKQVHEQAQKILENPLKTAEQYKQYLEPIITPYQFTKLKTRDTTLAAKFISKDGELDTEAVQKYVSEQVDKLLSSPSLKILTNVKYKAKLMALLKTAKRSTLYNIAYRLDQMNNQSLNDIFQEYLKQKNIEKPKVQLEGQDLNDVFDAAFVNEIIKRIDETNKNSQKSSAAEKKPPTRSQSAKKSS